MVRCAPLDHHIYHLVVRLPQNSDWSFLAGQYCLVSTDDGMHCPLSIASSPETLPEISFFVRVAGAGSLADQLIRAAQDNGILGVSPPMGACTWPRFSSGDLWIIAGGTGIAPVLSLLASKDARPCRIFWGVRHDQELFAHDMLSDLADKVGAEYVPVVEQPSAQWVGEIGQPHQVALAHQPPKMTRFLLAGGPPMVHAVRTALVNFGIAPTNIHSDLIDLGQIPSTGL
ncbi:MAG: hypothetical protein D6694_03625 [Gammaproteobacteria bacterium]|nr:MAG: hypothetical protein D6694_03625 [Gammaproteobacteria bacterium]